MKRHPWRFTGALLLLAVTHTSSLQRSVSPTAPRHLYLHIPFCRRRCFYCDFPIRVVGDRPGAADEAAENYVALVEREIRATESVYGQAVREAGGLRTVYFGGGTPSLTPPHLLDRLLRRVGEAFGVQGGAEVTMEMDPGTFDEDKLRAYVASGVNRVSLGVQSFDEELLVGAGRAHTVADALGAMDLLRRAGVENWSLDLISGLPHQTMETWESTLRQAVRCDPTHVSVYDLEVAAGTAFGKWYTAGAQPLPDSDLAADFYRLASSELTAAGYEHYEISNYARPGCRSRHNSCYWSMDPYLAVGLGASSFLQNTRFARPHTFAAYETWVDDLERQGLEQATTIGLAETEGVDSTAASDASESSEDGILDEMCEAVMVALRTADGLDLTAFAELYGQRSANAICESLAGAMEAKLVTVAHAPSDKQPEHGESDPSRRQQLHLNDPEGFLVSNTIISTVFAALERAKN